MSFEQMEVDELRKVAKETFAVDVSDTAQKKTVLKSLKEEGITFDMYVDDRKAHNAWTAEDEARFTPAEEEDESDEGTDFVDRSGRQNNTITGVKTVQPKEELLLIKMVRDNPSYQARGYKFTREHPFVPVREKDVEYFTESVGGFVMATPKQVREYYG
jgi:hypothetical protein